MSIFQDPSSLLRQGRKQLQEKAVSQAQQKFMGMVYAAKKGETPASPEVAKAAEGMSKKEARKFAKTKHEGLPTRKEEVEQIDEVAPLVGLGIRAGLAAGTALAGKSVYDSAKGVANKMKERNQKTQKAIEQLRNSYEPEIVNHLIENGFAETEENAINIMNHMSEEWATDVLNELSLGQIGGAVEKAADTYVKPNLQRIGAQKGREKAGNLPIIGDIGAKAGSQAAGAIYDKAKEQIKTGNIGGAIKTGKSALDMLKNSYENEVYKNDIMERENDEPGESDNNPDVKRHNRAVGYKPRARRPSVSGDPRYGSVSDSEWKRSSYNPANKRRKRY